MFLCFVAGNPQTQWDKIVHKMHTKDPLIGVNGSSNKGPHICSWLSLMDCIKLHKLTIFPVDTAEKQHFLYEADSQETLTSHGSPVHGLYGHLE